VGLRTITFVITTFGDATSGLATPRSPSDGLPGRAPASNCIGICPRCRCWTVPGRGLPYLLRPDRQRRRSSLAALCTSYQTLVMASGMCNVALSAGGESERNCPDPDADNTNGGALTRTSRPRRPVRLCLPPAHQPDTKRDDGRGRSWWREHWRDVAVAVLVAAVFAGGAPWWWPKLMKAAADGSSSAPGGWKSGGNSNPDSDGRSHVTISMPISIRTIPRHTSYGLHGSVTPIGSDGIYGTAMPRSGSRWFTSRCATPNRNGSWRTVIVGHAAAVGHARRRRGELSVFSGRPGERQPGAQHP
jgi:hypothetical protein